MSPLATIYSLLDSLKRNLSGRGIEATAERTMGDLKDFGREAASAQQGNGAAQESVTNKMLDKVLSMAPAGISGQILLHGGPEAVPILRTVLGGNSIFGPGFYTSNKLSVPHTFAAGRGNTGAISAYDMPDSLYAATFRANDKPLSKYPEVADRIMALFKKDEEARRAVLDTAKWHMKETGNSADAVLTGNLIEQVLRKHYGGMESLNAAMGAVGIPGRTWQYSLSKPAEMATLVYPDQYSTLGYLGSVPAAPGYEGFRAAQAGIKQLLGTAK